MTDGTTRCEVETGLEAAGQRAAVRDREEARDPSHSVVLASVEAAKSIQSHETMRRVRR